MKRLHCSSSKLLIITIATAAFLFGAVFSPAAWAADQPQTDNGYAYTVKNGKATITAYYGGGRGDILIVPSEIGGYPVTTIGNGAQTTFSNGNPGVFLIPDSVTKLRNRAIYDYNSTYFISIPASVTTIEDGATSSVAIASIAGKAGTRAESYAKQVGIGFSSEVVNLKAEAGAGGTMSITGNYLLPKKLQRATSLSLQVKANGGYQISDVQVDGASVAAAKGQSSYTLNYALQTPVSKDIVIKASFAPGGNASAGTQGEAKSAAPTYEFPDNGTSAGRYANVIGICAGKFYASTKDGKTVLYQLVKSYTSKDGSIKFRTSDELKKYASEHGLTYGKDYDYFHVYNYVEGTTAYYTAYLYKTYDGPMTGVEAKVGTLAEAQANYNAILDMSSIFAQNKAELTLKDWTFSDYSSYYGPREGTNFFGAGSAILADSEATLNLIDPSYNGGANVAFATYKGKVNISGGSLVGIARGAHGLYVANGGKMFMNATEGVTPTLTNRPDYNDAYITRDKKTQEIKLVNKLGADASALITVMGTGTVLATDSGGGTIVANHIVGKAYGQGSGGVYSIGSNDGLVWVYNSSLTSHMDAGLVSASGGYIYAYNDTIEGLMGIKLRAGQNSTKMSEVRVKNSSVTAFFDKDELERLFDVVTPEEAEAATAAGLKGGNFYLSLFAGRGSGVGSTSGSTGSNWFKDGYYTVPGSMGGSPFSVIYTEGSKTPIYIESTKLINKNYQKYKNAPGSKAQNLMIDAEGNGTANVFFINDNSKTKWDLTGVYNDTTEIVGDFYISENTESLEQRMMGGQGAGMPGGGMPGGGMPGGGQMQGGPGGGMPGGGEGGGMPGGQGMQMPSSGMPGGGMPGGGMPGGMNSGTKGNFINATFQNSEWTGTVLGVAKNARLNFDEKSSWKLTADTTIDKLTVAPGTVITADKPVKLSVVKLEVTGGGAFQAGKNVTIEMRKENTKEDAKDAK